ncbi:cytochrome P450 [Podospora aff. communis PSN243]|uniref:Cytochrome P450 n=1 Tax=Podospora aff. communis PSN243 TaxID=3040156 RepID=A0AAV9GXQ9_9PEZI|nr:cytochrome P450 [Podospora aff. communis PSN243]
MGPDWSARTNQEYYDWVGSQTVIVVGPDQMTLYTQDAEVINQITMRKEAFPKDVARYGLLTMFGRNVVTTEGAVWRMHRKVTASSFNEKNAAHTFAEALEQTKGLVDYLFYSEDKSADSSGTIKNLDEGTIIWALNIIGYVGFGLRLIFPGQEPPEDPKLKKYGRLDPPPGYTMSFAASLGGLLERIIAILIFPPFLLKRLPFKFTKHAWGAKENYKKYMDEFLIDKIEEVRQGEREQVGMDIMGELVRSVYGEKDKNSKAGSANNILTDDEIISNAFIMTLAGHETTANVLHFALIFLAAYPSAQRRLQKDIDTILGDADSSTWDYDSNINALLASYVGACMNETMRLLPPVTTIPKIVSPSSDQNLSINGRRYVAPAGLSINITAPSAHRNPRYWPTQPSQRTGKPTDLEDWLPERWYRNTSKGETSSGNTDDEEDFGGFTGSDTSASLYRPARGSYVPFSDGPRSCLGRRIAVVELAAALPGIFQKYSIELAVDKWATDEEVAKMSPEAKRQLYRKAQKSAWDEIDNATAIITLKFHNGQYVPIRLSLKKNDLELQLDEYISDNASQFQSDPKLAPYFSSRARTVGSPVKKEAPELKVSKRRATKAIEDSIDVDESDEPSRSTSTALARTPGRALSLASRIPLPATPADVASAVDRGTVAIRKRAASLYQDSGITEATQVTRESLSTVKSIIYLVAAFELYYLRPEVLPDRYAFTIPAIGLLGTSDYPVLLPDMFALLTTSFWSPAATWVLTSILLPAFFGYFFNLSAAHAPSSSRGRPRASQPEYNVDPLTFSVAKAIATYVVYAQGVTFGGLINHDSVARINSALYSGWKGVIVGTAVTGLSSFYDAVLKK